MHLTLMQETRMTGTTRIAALRYALTATGVIFIIGIYTLAQVWPTGWTWGEGHSHFWPMILGVYATLGVFLIMASRDPLANRSLIWFTVWSSVVHAVIMAVQGIADPAERGHLVGDVPALLLVAALLAFLTRRAATSTQVTDLGARRVA
jgi:FtsH-binding integral membrane protein